MGRKNTIEDFWLNVDKNGENGCYIWTGCRHHGGYGLFRYNGMMYVAHRFAYMLAHGMDSIPEGMCVCHSCDIRPCVRDTHLWLGTKQDNSEDMYNKGRAARGELVGTARLTKEEVNAIRAIYEDGGITKTQLAKEFGVCSSTIGYITRGIYWKQ